MRRLICLTPIFLCCAFSTPESAYAQEATVETVATNTDDPQWLDQYRPAALQRWEKSIADLEALNASEESPPDAVLFIGSSSIRRWDDISINMAPYRTIRRGYGGAKFSDVAVFAKRLIQPHQYRALVIFVGNDVTGKENDHTPEQIEQLVEYVVGISHDHVADAPVFLIEVTPTESRFKAWSKIRVANARLREIALRTPNTYFIPTAGQFLLPDGTPRSDLFADDRLHLNELGYDLWSTLIRRRLDEVFRLSAEIELASPDVELGDVETQN